MGWGGGGCGGLCDIGLYRDDWRENGNYCLGFVA